MSEGTYSYDPELGYIPAIPEPFWYSGWRTWFRYRPACYQCGKPMLFKDRAEWARHYALNHIDPAEELTPDQPGSNPPSST